MVIIREIGRSSPRIGKGGMAAVSEVMDFLGSSDGESARGKYLIHVRNDKTGNEIVVNGLTDAVIRNGYLIFKGIINYITIRIDDIAASGEYSNNIQIVTHRDDITYTVHPK